MLPADFMPLLEELLAFHPGLAFLESTPEFQEKYARTVIARIFYVNDPLCCGYIDARSLRKSNLLRAFHTVDMEEDINMVRIGTGSRVSSSNALRAFIAVTHHVLRSMTTSLTNTSMYYIANSGSSTLTMTSCCLVGTWTNTTHSHMLV